MSHVDLDAGAMDFALNSVHARLLDRFLDRSPLKLLLRHQSGLSRETRRLSVEGLVGDAKRLGYRKHTRILCQAWVACHYERRLKRRCPSVSQRCLACRTVPAHMLRPGLPAIHSVWRSHSEDALGMTDPGDCRLGARM